ncbi:putative methyltransferase-domain-containing protein [Podospora australis]|uniref:25S rRNA adenine-N(1) methyltransferase n=1 Tax=Podospora australis TaxID=1536484 RepID=A0AAN6WRA0_9PEZI|nr:putative methyltransferase-domain-containing protein [Podospora australis]
MAVKKKRPQKSLAAGRPPLLQRPKPKSITRKATKALINKHHLLEKRKQQAIKKGDNEAVAQIEAEIEALGGLESYQQASLQGQREDRGGDSSRVLMQWLQNDLASHKEASGRPLRMLEVGALSTQNACSQSGHFDITRIDLNSQGEGILQQDFMERPLPNDDSERFDIVSLSLVLNFVPDPKGRGDMLRRTTQFLLGSGKYLDSPSLNGNFPSLFLVLPAPCVTNSRYLDDDRLTAIMTALGYTKVASKTTQRLVYYLWKRESKGQAGKLRFPKQEIRAGSTRNNFAVVFG